MEQKFGVDEQDRLDEDHVKSSSKRQPFCAIVKDLLCHDAPFTEKLLNKVLNYLQKMRRFGVYSIDVQARNYKGGLLVDMGEAMTTPHFLFYIKPAWQVRFWRQNDLVGFEKMARDAGRGQWMGCGEG